MIIILSYFVAVSVTEDRGKIISIKKGGGDYSEISTATGTHCFQFSLMCEARLVRSPTKGSMGRLMSERLFDVVKNIFTFHYLVGSCCSGRYSEL